MTKKLMLILALSSFLAFGKDGGSNKQILQKLDLILQKVDGIEKRVTKLENENDNLQKDLNEVEKSAKEIKNSQQIVIPKDERENQSFYNKLRIGIQSDSDRNKGPWTKIETWKMVKRNLTGHQIRSILGNPNKIKGNLSPRIDQVYHYLGDLDADGTEETALVNFYRDRVVSFKSPFE